MHTQHLSLIPAMGIKKEPLFWNIQKAGPLFGVVAMVYRVGDVTQEEMDANAHLFFAASDLLETLEAMLRHTDGWDEVQLRKRWGEQFVSEILAARAAVAKAKGDSQ